MEFKLRPSLKARMHSHLHERVNKTKTRPHPMEGDVRKLDPRAGQWGIHNHKLAFTSVSNLNTYYLVARKQQQQPKSKLSI